MIDSKNHSETLDKDLVANQHLLKPVICSWIVKAPGSIGTTTSQKRSELDPPDTVVCYCWPSSRKSRLRVYSATLDDQDYKVAGHKAH